MTFYVRVRPPSNANERIYRIDDKILVRPSHERTHEWLTKMWIMTILFIEKSLWKIFRSEIEFLSIETRKCSTQSVDRCDCEVSCIYGISSMWRFSWSVPWEWRLFLLLRMDYASYYQTGKWLKRRKFVLPLASCSIIGANIVDEVSASRSEARLETQIFDLE